MRPRNANAPRARGASAEAESNNGNHEHSTPLAIYAVCDRQERDHYKDPCATQLGRLRILGEYVEVEHAIAACRLLRWAGSAAQVVLITSVRSDG